MHQPPFPAMRDALAAPSSSLFWIERGAAGERVGDPESFYGSATRAGLTFDVSNNKVLANVAPDGSIERLTIYRSSFPASTYPPYWSGVWTHKDFSSWGPYSFRLRVGETVADLRGCGWPSRTSLLGGYFPLTELRGPGLRVALLTFAPIDGEGATRPRGVVTGAYLTNTTSAPLSGAVLLPELFRPDNEIREARVLRAGIPMTCDVELAMADEPVFRAEVPFSLAAGESTWVAAVLHAPGEPVGAEIASIGSLGWLNRTWAFHESMTGTLRVPDDPFQAEYPGRAAAQSFGCVNMDGTGEVAGSNWGTSPPTTQTWMRDLYYSVLPLHILEPRLFRDVFLWFAKHGVRYRGATHEGGVTHALANSLAPVIMAGLYYESTADRGFLLGAPGLRDRILSILSDVEASRPEGSPWLFTSRYLSDGAIIGDFHPGSNVCSWHAFASAARLFGEVWGEPTRATRYSAVAQQVREAIESRCVIPGPFGPQYVEAINADGTVPFMVHDGEESDTTLMSFYGYCEIDYSPFRNYARFALSEHNGAYSPVTRGIKWGASVEPSRLNVPATFPGHTTALVNAIGGGPGTDGPLAEIRHLADIDGSPWWWPYSGPETLEYGKVARGTGKCGWGAGVFLALWITQILGIRFDAPRRSVRFRPLRPAAPFSWERMRYGSGELSVGSAREGSTLSAWVENRNLYPVTATIELVPDPGVAFRSVTCPPGAQRTAGKLFDRTTAVVTMMLEPGERVEASGKG